jgi:hypothetical protein
MVACRHNTQDSGNRENALLGDETNIWYVAGLDNTNMPEEWVKGLHLEKLMGIAFKPILSGQIDVYSPDQDFFVDKKVSLDKIKKQLGWTNGVTNYNELKEMFFYEKWSTSSNLKSFKKDVQVWCPIQVWRQPDNQICKRKSFYVKSSSKDKGIIVGESVFTEFDFSNPSPFPRWYGFDANKYVNLIFDNVQANKLKVYDPVYIVDKSMIQLNSSKLKETIGQSLESDDLRKSICSFIFEENWYIDSKSLNLYKEVKSIGFVKKYWENGDYKSKILFFLKLE